MAFQAKSWRRHADQGNTTSKIQHGRSPLFEASKTYSYAHDQQSMICCTALGQGPQSCPVGTAPARVAGPFLLLAAYFAFFALGALSIRAGRPGFLFVGGRMAAIRARMRPISFRMS